MCIITFAGIDLVKIVAWVKLSFNSESSPLFTRKISTLGIFQNLNYEQRHLKWEIPFVDPLSVALTCAYNAF